MVTTARTEGVSASFRWEVELAPVVESRFKLFVPNSFHDAPLSVFSEVPAAVGVVDLLAITFRSSALAAREELGIGPICSPLRIRSLDLLTTKQIKRVDTLARHLGTSETSLRKSTLGPLAEDGLIELAGGRVHSTGIWTPLGEAITAVELKLSKWRSALRQADNFGLSADYSWVVLDEERSKSARHNKEIFRALGVGLATADSAGEIRTVVKPRLRPPIRWLRALIAERAWACRHAHSGQTQPSIQKSSSHALL
jgi:hypothetical protein